MISRARLRAGKQNGISAASSFTQNDQCVEWACERSDKYNEGIDAPNTANQ